MTGLILVVDDLEPNVKLLEVKLTSEYYDVITASNGLEAIKSAKENKPDIILLDVMMPGMDGFEACRKLKEDPEVSHIPVVMVTALSEASDRVRGLEAGADDFLTKPINDTALLARVRSLIRIKVLLDELRLRDQTGAQLGVLMNGQNSFTSDVSGSRILVIDDDVVQSGQIKERLAGTYHVELATDPSGAEDIAYKGNFDLIIISTQLADVDALRLTSHFRSHEETRNVPILVLIDEDDQRTFVKGLEMGVNDYLITPVDFNEMTARIKTQIRRKKYQETLKNNYQQSVNMAITDSLTRLYNRHYLDTHLANMVKQAIGNRKPLSLLIMDMDHFKSVNDTYGHSAGDEVLRQLSEILVKSIRSSDLPARYGGEEFVLVMPETALESAKVVAERIRSSVEKTPFKITHQVGQINKTISIGMAELKLAGDTVEDLIKRADEALYRAKSGGRNRVEISENW